MLNSIRSWIQRRLEALRGAPGTTPATPERPLPPGLHQRLRAIADSETLCRDLDRGWAELARGELPTAEAGRLRRHLKGCDRCTAVYAALETAALEPPRPLPAALTFRLNALGRPGSRKQRRLPKMPVWIRDLRTAAALSYLGTLLVLALVGNPVEAGARGVETLSPSVKDFFARVEVTGTTVWNDLGEWQSRVRTEAQQELEKRRETFVSDQQKRLKDWQQQLEGFLAELRDSTPSDVDEADPGHGVPQGGAAAA